MQLGPVQRKWIQALKDNPEQQITGKLGERVRDGELRFCCLGKGLHVLKGDDAIVRNTVQDLGCSSFLSHSYQELGLRASNGAFKQAVTIGVRSYWSLSSMNDGAMGWVAIAEYMEKNPENVFQTSV